MPGQGDDFRTIWLSPADDAIVQIIDQRRLPHEYRELELRHWQDGLSAINDMAVRGAPLIGATAAWSLYLAARTGGRSETERAATELLKSRPTAVNLAWAVKRVRRAMESLPADADLAAAIREEAEAICNEDIDISLGIGHHGLELIRDIARQKSGPVNILTHCNAGALATINWGTATAPIYLAQKEAIDVHVWVDETRPRNQGSQLTAWELGQRGVSHTLIVDNAGGHLMQHGQVDLVITGTDRTTRTGDVANKIGTYLKALAAHDNDIPFYVALPSTTIDWDIRDGLQEIPIEQRDTREVSHIVGELDGRIVLVNTTANNTPISNYAFDVTPARLVTGLITERGVCAASEEGLLALFPEHAS
ncbi:MAG TPA: S-methyl-5-thioribose-1-phosphate isomerase [Woeseiaceae bacterium]|nr:S-methyl-5-thioribose-1-phosphate isomerase [Woeseiaceae bacterium]